MVRPVQGEIEMKRHKTQKGAAMVEIALSLLIMLLLTIGLFEMARGMWVYTTLSHAARQGARFAMVRGNASASPATIASIEQRVKSQAIGLDPNNISVAVTWEDSGTMQGGDFVQIRATYPLTMITGSAFFGHSVLNLGSTSRVTISY